MGDKHAMNASFDTIVIGCGGMGSSATFHLATLGKRTLALERFDVPNAMGSSHGVNRIIRLAYYEDPSYVPLLRRAYELWDELSLMADEPIILRTGSVDASEPDGEVFAGALESCLIHRIEHEVLSSTDLTNRFPGYQLPSGHRALYQKDGGFVLSERAIVAHALLARERGATIRAREAAVEWQPTSWGVRVTTTRGTYDAESLVITAGPWMGELVPSLKPLLSPERQVLAWFNPLEPRRFQPDQFPVFNLTVPEGRYYGFPEFGIPGFKVGRYHHLEEQVDPETIDREPGHEDEAVLRSFTERYFPAAAGSVATMRACMFTNTPDEHFLVDRLPDLPVVVASPCSGHGYKFCSVMGEILAELAIRGETRHDIDLFRIDRFADSKVVG